MSDAVTTWTGIAQRSVLAEGIASINASDAK